MKKINKQQLIRFMEKNNLFFHSRAIWQYDPRLNVSSIVFPYHNKIRIGESDCRNYSSCEKKDLKKEESN